MTIETLQTRIDNSNKKIEKLEKKLERINIALNGGANPYYYSERDLRSTTKELETAKQNLLKLNQQLAIEVNKEKAPKVKALVEFLEGWKQNANDFYRRQAVELYKLYEEYENSHNGYDREQYRKFRLAENEFPQIVRLYRKYTAPYVDEVKLEECLNKEVKCKYYELVYRIKDVVGEIVDCSALEIANNGSINGIVIGTNGKARLETIMAGGYNIQCLHYRVLVHKFN